MEMPRSRWETALFRRLLYLHGRHSALMLLPDQITFRKNCYRESYNKVQVRLHIDDRGGLSVPQMRSRRRVARKFYLT